MTYSEMISKLVGRRFARRRWKEGTYIYYGHLPTDKYRTNPMIILVQNRVLLKKFTTTHHDIKGDDWYEL